MSMSESDYAQDQYLADLYEEHREEALEEFTEERLRSYYDKNELLAQPAFDFLSEARRLDRSNATARFIFAAVVIEVGLKAILFRPIVYGLVHDESTAALIVHWVLRSTGGREYKKLLFHILQKHGGVDLD